MSEAAGARPRAAAVAGHPDLPRAPRAGGGSRSRRPPRAGAAALACAALALGAAPARAASPQLDRVLPRGGQRGTEVRVTLAGARLADAVAVLFDAPGVTARDLRAKGARAVEATFVIAPDCPPGEVGLRVRCRSGLSELRTFWVGALPQVAEREPNDDPARAQRIAPGVTLEGTLRPEDADWFVFTGRAGQRVAAEVEATRLGGPVTDPVLSLWGPAGADGDPRGPRLAHGDDAPLLGQDALVAAVLPADGEYRVLLREASFRGGDQARYRLHLGDFPRPLAAWPPGGPPAALEGAALLGDLGADAPGAPRRARALGPVDADGFAPLFVRAPRLGPALDPVLGPWLARALGPEPTAPTPLRVRPDPPGLGHALEREPDDDRRAATEVAIPGALHGRLDRAGDADWFRFAAKKGERLRVQAFARALGAPLDLVLDLFAAGGRRLAGGDDAQGRPDPDFAFVVPEDGRYELRVRDFFDRGDPASVYRVEVAPPAPALALELASYRRNGQERQALAVPRGNRMAVLARVVREGAAGPVTVALDGLPGGTAHVDSAACAGDVAVVPVVVEAAADAPLEGGWCDLTVALARDPSVAGGLRQRVALTTGAPNDAVYWTRTATRLAVAVVEPAPFRVRLAPPAVPLVRGGALELEVEVERDPGFAAPVVVTLLADPAGVASRKDLPVPAPGAGSAPVTSAALGLTANDRAALGRHPLVAVARASTPGGDVWASSGVVWLDVEAPFLRLDAPRAALAQGAAGELAATVTVDRAWAGVATVRVVGLPPRCAAPPVTLGAGETLLRVPLTVGADARVGRHRNVFFEVLVPLPAGTGAGDGAVHHVVHRLGATELRIDPPAAAGSGPASPAAAAAPAASRLERLRAERAARREGGDVRPTQGLGSSQEESP